MSTTIGTGISTKLDSFQAGKEAALNAYRELGRLEPSIIITFISTIFDQQETIRGIRSIIKDAPLVGCSSIGGISAYGSHRNSVSVFIISSNSLRFSCGAWPDLAKNSRIAGHKAARIASENINNSKQACIMFSDGLSGSGADTLRGAQEVLGTSFPIIGGGTCNEERFQKTYQYFDNDIHTDSVSILLISGNITVGVGKASGWQPIGKPHKVTKANSNIIKEIDKKPAVEIYEDYFEKSFEELTKEGIAKLGINYPLGIHRITKTKEYLTRVPLRVQENGELILNGDMQEGEYISLMIGDKDMILESAKEASLEAVSNIKNPRIKFAVIFSDISRFLLLRKDAGKEIEIVKEAIGKNTPILGCYTCGEYAPSNADEFKGQFCFNNQAISVAVFSE